MSIFISILLSMINLIVSIGIITNSKDGKLFDSLCEFVCELFKDRNVFGIFLSLFVCILLSPSFTFVIDVIVVKWILRLFKYIIIDLFPFISKFFYDIWDLGNKKKS